MNQFHSKLPADSEPVLVVTIAGKKFTVLEVNGKYDIYDFEDKLTQPGHDQAGVARYLMHAFHGLDYLEKKTKNI